MKSLGLFCAGSGRTVIFRGGFGFGFFRFLRDAGETDGYAYFIGFFFYDFWLADFFVFELEGRN